MLVLHVDDGTYFTKDRELALRDIATLKRKYQLEHEPLNWYVGLRISQTKERIKVTGDAYIEQCAMRFKVENHAPLSCPAVDTPKHWEGESMCQQAYMEIIGCLTYTSNACRPDVAQIVNLLASFMQCPSTQHLSMARNVLMCLYHTKELGLTHERTNVRGGNDKNKIRNMKLSAYFDSDFATCSKTRKSRSGVLVCYNDQLVLWASIKQTLVALSAFEAETIAGNLCYRRILHLRKIAADLSLSHKEQKHTCTHGDNEKAMSCAAEDKYGKQSKHFEVRCFKLAEGCTTGVLDIAYIASAKNPADLLTKVTSATTFKNLVHFLVS